MPSRPKLQVSTRQIPPLSQSRHSEMGCGRLYALRQIEGVRTESEASRRGSQIHDVISGYVRHLIATRQKDDHEYLDTICEGVTEDAMDVLQTFRESFTFNPMAVLGTEIRIALDAEWRPCLPGELAEYEGTLDLVTLQSEIEATIEDWKSYFQIIDADTFQSKLYPLLLFSINPSLQKIRFILDFVRYGTAHREVVFTREDVPKLKRLVENQRARQKALHAQEEFDATPGRHCAFCPKLTDATCPIAETNPYGQMTQEQRVGFAVWLKQATKENTRILKDLMIEGGPIDYKDLNEVTYRAEFRRMDRRSYPLGNAYRPLTEWFEKHPADRDLLDKLTVSGLSSPLKAQKRAALKEEMEKIAQVSTLTKFTVGQPGEKPEADE